MKSLKERQADRERRAEEAAADAKQVAEAVANAAGTDGKKAPAKKSA